jgi:hypothetical protein
VIREEAFSKEYCSSMGWIISLYPNLPIGHCFISLALLASGTFVGNKLRILSCLMNCVASAPYRTQHVLKTHFHTRMIAELRFQMMSRAHDAAERSVSTDLALTRRHACETGNSKTFLYAPGARVES